MSSNAQPIFVGSVRNESAKIITGSTAESGSGSTKLFQADPTNGSRIHAISGLFADTVTTLTVCRLWLESSGLYTLIASIPLPTYTQASGVPAPVINLLDADHIEFIDPVDRFLTLDAGDSLYVSVYDDIESNLHVTAWGGDY